jgi:hypothetical protein
MSCINARVRHWRWAGRPWRRFTPFLFRTCGECTGRILLGRFDCDGQVVEGVAEEQGLGLVPPRPFGDAAQGLQTLDVRITLDVRWSWHHRARCREHRPGRSQSGRHCWSACIRHETRRCHHRRPSCPAAAPAARSRATASRCGEAVAVYLPDSGIRRQVPSAQAVIRQLRLGVGTVAALWMGGRLTA